MTENEKMPRIHALSPAQRNILFAVAGLGPDIDRRLLARVAEGSLPMPTPAWSLRDAGLIEIGNGTPIAFALTESGEDLVAEIAAETWARGVAEVLNGK